MTTPETPATLREELQSLEAQIAELQRHADELRSDLAETSDKSATIEAAEQQEALISQLDVRRRELMERIESA
jgi:flagellar biosynthesis chaperone FliJ